LRLLHLVNLQGFGGIQRDFADFVSTQVSGEAVSHHVLLSRPGIAPSLAAQVRAGCESIECLRHVAGVKIPPALGFILRYRFKAALRRIQPDAVVLWSNPRALAGLPLPARHALVYYEHGAVWFGGASDKRQSELARVDGIVCNSNASARMVALRWGVTGPARIQVCANAVKSAPAPACEPRRLPAGTLTLGLAGRMEALKGFALVIQALRLLLDQGKSVRLCVAGDGPARSALEALAQRLGVSEAIDFLGFVDDMGAFYERIDLFLCPSLREPFGLVCAEAMAYALPVLCTAVDGLTEVVSDGVSGICIPPTLPLADYPGLGGQLDGVPELVYDPLGGQLVTPRLLDPRRIADVVADLMDSPQRYTALSAGALADARARTDYSTHVGEVLGAIKRICAARGSSK